MSGGINTAVALDVSAEIIRTVGDCDFDSPEDTAKVCPMIVACVNVFTQSHVIL